MGQHRIRARGDQVGRGGTHEERECGAVVAATLGLEDVPDMTRDVFLGVFTLADDRGSQDGIGRSDTGGEDERRQELEAGDDGVHERSGSHPSEEHSEQGESIGGHDSRSEYGSVRVRG